MNKSKPEGETWRRRLRAARRKLDLSQEELGRRWNISRGYVVALEKGERRITEEMDDDILELEREVENGFPGSKPDTESPQKITSSDTAETASIKAELEIARRSLVKMRNAVAMMTMELNDCERVISRAQAKADEPVDVKAMSLKIARVAKANISRESQSPGHEPGADSPGAGNSEARDPRPDPEHPQAHHAHKLGTS